MRDKRYAELYVRRFTFCGFETPYEETPFILLGVPLDSTSSLRPGTRLAPFFIRLTSLEMETFSLRYSADLERVGVHDVGDLSVVQGDVGGSIKRLSKVLREVISDGKRVALLGGEHTISLAAGDIVGEELVLVLDAHLDLRDEYPHGQKLSHATVTRRLAESSPSPLISVIGIRAASAEELEYAGKRGIVYFEARGFDGEEVARRINRYSCEVGKDRAYISIDFDVFDPSYAPGVGTPEPEGLAPHQVLDFIHHLNLDIIGFDVCEVCPPHDPSWITSALAAKLVVETFSKIYSSIM